jgi:hypothetical protein
MNNFGWGWNRWDMWGAPGFGWNHWSPSWYTNDWCMIMVRQRLLEGKNLL